MAVKIELKRSSVPGKIPTTASLDLGELAINTYDGAVYLKREINTTQSIVSLLSTAYTGSLPGTASWAYNAVTASYALNANIDTGSLVTTSSFNAFTASYNTGSFTGSFTGTLEGTSSWAINAITASYALNGGGGTPGGSDTQLQFNSGSTLSGSTNLTFDYNTNYLQLTGSQVIGGSNGRILLTPTVSNPNTAIQEIHANDDYPWIARFYNDTFSNTNSVMSYFGWSDGRFVFHNDSTQSIGLQVNGYSAENGLLVYQDKVAFVNNVEITGSLNAPSITGSLYGTASWAENAITASYVSGAVQLTITEDPGGAITDSSFLFVSASDDGTGYEYWYRNKGVLWNQNWIEDLTDTGIIYGGVVTFSGTDILVTPGAGLIINHNAVTGSHVSPTPKYVSWGPITASADFVTSSQVTYLLIDQFGSLEQQTKPLTIDQFHEKLPLGLISSFTTSSIDAFAGIRATSYGQNEQAGAFIRSFGPLKINGFDIQPQTGSLKVSIASGTAFRYGGFYAVDPETPSTFTAGAVATGSMVRIYRDPNEVGGFLQEDNNGSYYTDIDPTQWDDGSGTLQPVGASNWTIQRMFYGPLSQRPYTYYGQSIYGSLAAAVQSITTEQFVEATATQEALVFIGYLIIKGDTVDLGDAANKVLQAGLYRNTAGSSGAGGAAATYLTDLADVNIVAPTTGQALVYNAGYWENGSPLSATSASFASTASYVENAQTASYVLNAVSASYASTASYVENAISSSYPISVTGSTLYSVDPAAGPTFSTNNSIILGTESGYQATNSSYSNFLGTQAGYQATNAPKANFVGYRAGYQATGAYNSNFIGVCAGQYATYADKSNFIGHRAGESATNAYRSNFIGRYAGFGATNACYSNIIGEEAGYGATEVIYSNFLGSQVGYQAVYANHSNFIGQQTGYQAANANNSNFFGCQAGFEACDAYNSNFLGQQAGYNAIESHNSNFIGSSAGNNATYADNSTFIGQGAGFFASAAYQSNFLGFQAGSCATNARYSNFLGSYSGYQATNACLSNFLGNGAGYCATNAYYSNFLGAGAGGNATNACCSNFIGNSAGYCATNACFSTFAGSYSGYYATNACSSNFLGTCSGYQATNAYYSTFIGTRSGYCATNACFSTFSGYRAGYCATNSFYSNFIGVSAGESAYNANYSNFLGRFAGYNAINACFSTFSGYRAGYNAQNACYSNFLGSTSGYNATSACFSNFLGSGAGLQACYACNSTFLGAQSGFNAQNASHSTFSGYRSGFNAVNANNSNFLGSYSGYQAAYAYRSIFIGASAGSNATYSYYSNFIGTSAGQGATCANNSTFIGNNAGTNSTYACNSNFIGNSAGTNSTYACNSNFIGLYAGSNAQSACFANMMGQEAGQSQANSCYSNFIGFKAGLRGKFHNPLGPNNIIIGTNISLPDYTQDSINIGGLIYGTGTNSNTGGDPSLVPANGNVGINVVTPNYNFEVNGTVAFPTLPSVTNTKVVGIDSVTGELSIQDGGGGAFLKSRTPANITSSVVDYDSIFNPSNLLVQDTSVFYVDSTSYYYVLGDLINSGSIVVDGILKIGGVLYNIGTITGTGTII